MRYNNQYDGRYSYNRFSPYSNRFYNSPNFQRPNLNGLAYMGQSKKHSGCTTGFVKGDAARPFVRGWKYDKRNGLRSFIAGPNKKTKRVSSKNGREWENWTAKVQSGSGVELFNALYDCQKKRVYIKDLGLVMSPNGGRGGYVGPFYKRR